MSPLRTWRRIAPDRFPVEVRFQKARYASLRSFHGDDYRENPFIAVHFHRRAFPIVCIQTVVPIINTIARYIRLHSRRRPSLTDIHFVRKYLCNIRLRCGQLVIVKHRPILVVFGSSFLRQIGLKFCFHIPPRLTCVYALIGKYFSKVQILRLLRRSTTHFIDQTLCITSKSQNRQWPRVSKQQNHDGHIVLHRPTYVRDSK